MILYSFGMRRSPIIDDDNRHIPSVTGAARRGRRASDMPSPQRPLKRQASAKEVSKKVWRVVLAVYKGAAEATLAFDVLVYHCPIAIFRAQGTNYGIPMRLPLMYSTFKIPLTQVVVVSESNQRICCLCRTLEKTVEYIRKLQDHQAMLI